MSGITHIWRNHSSTMSDYRLSSDGYAAVSFYDYINSHGLLYSQPIPGLYYFPGPILGDKAISNMNNMLNPPPQYADPPTGGHDEPWNRGWEPVGTGANSRMAIHYGYKYNYKTGNTKEPAPPMPSYIRELRTTVRGLEVPGISTAKQAPLDQCIINKYEPGQGINAHTDHKDYGDAICCFTLGSGATMHFTNKKSGAVVDLYVEHNSWYVMTGESRWEWTHEMKSRKSDVVSGVKIARGVRTSITFRSVSTGKIV